MGQSDMEGVCDLHFMIECFIFMVQLFALSPTFDGIFLISDSESVGHGN